MQVIGEAVRRSSVAQAKTFAAATEGGTSLQRFVAQRGLGEIGHLLSCQRDGSFCEGYDPKLTFTRTRTIMQGESHCDVRYRYDVPDLTGA